MKFIVKPHPEIFIKSESVRKRFTKILERNIRTILQRRTESVAVFNRRDYIEVTSESDKYFKETLEVLTQTPGIHHSLKFSNQNLKTCTIFTSKFLSAAVVLLKVRLSLCELSVVVNMTLPLSS